MRFPSFRLSVLAISLHGLWLGSTCAEAITPITSHQDKNAPSFVFADRIEGNPESQLSLLGNAEIQRDNTTLKGDSIHYTQATDEVVAQGNTSLTRDGYSFMAPEMKFRIDAREGEMTDATYRIEGVRGNHVVQGCAKTIAFTANDKTELTDAKFSACSKDDEAWFIKMNRLELDEFDRVATAHDAVLNFYGVPIMASPWLKFPITGERRSGFLTPTIGLSSVRGFDFTLPYYLNLAPNYDATLMPRFMTRRGVMLGGQTRFLYNQFKAEVDGTYLPHDRETKTDRYSVHIKAEQKWRDFTARVNYNRVSDKNYETDFGSSIRETSNKVLPQDFSLSYDRTYWNAAISVNRNQPLDTEYIPYQREPQIVLNHFVGDYKGFELRSRMDFTRFTSKLYPDGDRFYIQQSVAYPIRQAGWFVVPKAQWLGAWYDVKHRERTSYTGVQYHDKHPSRIVPTFSLDSGLIFERDTTWFGESALQTLEPRVYYVYTPYHNQRNIPIFDTTVNELNFATLFSPNQFAGVDRVSAANQVTTALTTRYIDANSGNEFFRASLGQRYHFSQRLVPYDGEASPTHRLQRSDLLGSVAARLYKGVWASADTQYSATRNKFTKTRVGLEFKPKPLTFVGLYYRHQLPDVEASYQNYGQRDKIHQVDLAVQVPLTNRLYGLMRYNYSLRNRKPIEMLMGLEYVHNCWTIRFVAQRYVTGVNKYDTNAFVQLELNGFGYVGTNPFNELKRNIKGYQSPTPY